MADPRVFEEAYRALRAEGAKGWGGERFGQRLQGWRDMLDVLDAHRLLPPPGPVLELGSGSGMVTRLLVRRGYAVDGIELSKTAVEWAREAGVQGARHHVGDVTDLSRWGSQTQDMVVDANCLHCILGINRLRCISGVRRLLAPNGLFLVSSMVGPAKELPEGTRFADGQLLKNDKPVRTLIEPEALVTELQEVGFSVVFRTLHHNLWWDHIWLLLRRTA